MSRSRACASRSASRCRAKSACNGGATCWRATGHGDVEGNPVAAELLLAIRHCDLPVERLSRLIDEHQFDLYNDPMPTMAALEGYINDTVGGAVLARRAELLGGNPTRSSTSRAMPASRKALPR